MSNFLCSKELVVPMAPTNSISQKDSIHYLLEYGYDDIYVILRYDWDPSTSTINERYWHCLENDLKMTHMRVNLDYATKQHIYKLVEQGFGVWDAIRDTVIDKNTDVIYQSPIFDLLYDSLDPGIYWYKPDQYVDSEINLKNILLSVEIPDKFTSHCHNYYYRVINTINTPPSKSPIRYKNTGNKSPVYYMNITHPVQQGLLYILQAFRDAKVESKLYVNIKNPGVYQRYASENVIFVSQEIGEYNVYICFDNSVSLEMISAYSRGKAILAVDKMWYDSLINYIPITKQIYRQGDKEVVVLDTSEIVMYLKIIDMYPRYLNRYMR